MTARVEAGAPGATTAPATRDAGGPAGAFARALERAASALDRAESAAVAPASEPDATALLRLQVDVYRRAERLELASKLLDYGVGAVKTLLQTRV